MYDQTSAGRDREMDVGGTSYDSTSLPSTGAGTDYTGTGTGYATGTEQTGTDYTGTGTDYTSGSATSSETTGSAGGGSGMKEKAGTAAKTGAQAASGTAKDVAQTARDEARNVASEATSQARHIAGDVKEQLRSQAHQQHGTMVNKLRQASDEMREMAQGREQSPASSLVSSIAERTNRFADQLESRGPEGVLSEVQDFARRKPGTFLIAAAAAGFVVGRLGKSIFSGQQDDGAERSYREAYDAGSADTFAGFRDTGAGGTYGSATGTAAVAGMGDTAPASGYATPTETTATIRDDGDFTDPRPDAVVPGSSAYGTTSSYGTTEGGRS